MLVLKTVLSLGLNLLIARLKLNPKWARAVWCVIVLNEIRGAYMAYEGFFYLF